MVGGAGQSSQIAFVVYDSKNGKIIHIHRFVAAEGELPTEDELAAQALENARRLHHRDSSFGMSVIRVAPKDLRPGVYYEVDLQRKKLVMKVPPNFESDRNTRPLEILKMRLAKGEIAKDEYFDLCKIMQDRNI